MLKLCGCICLVLGGWGLGAYLVTRDKRQLSMGDAMLDLVRFIRAQMGSFCRPRAALFSLYDHAYLSLVGFTDALRESGSISTALERSSSSADREVTEWMKAFDKELGRTYVEGQLAICDYYIARLETHLRTRRETQPSRTRVWRTITLAGALLLVLLLL